MKEQAEAIIYFGGYRRPSRGDGLRRVKQVEQRRVELARVATGRAVDMPVRFFSIGRAENFGQTRMSPATGIAKKLPKFLLFLFLLTFI